jgi:outer membrane protein assembly factor BamB
VRKTTRLVGMCAMWLALAAGQGAWGADTSAEQAKQILDATGFRGGLIVHVGCSDGNLTASLRANDSTLVHGLDTDAANVAAARKHIRSLGLYGPVSVDVFDGKHLPYADNLVNLLIADELGDVPMKEVLRVLAPRGVALVGGTKTVKPRPDEIDEWTHYLHSASGNPVAEDDAVQPPRQLQWVASPKWGRHHEHMASMNAMVSSDGKVFSICDQGPKVSMLHPPQWKLSAHDAFNGLLLWERPIAKWFNHLQPLKSGPASLPRRLVAKEQHVYVTVGIDAPVSILDANTGKTLRICKGTENTQEIVLSDNTLFLVRGIAKGTAITAVNAETGAVLWDKQSPVSTFTLTVDETKVVFFDGQKVVALNRKDGSTLWASRNLGEQGKATWIGKNPPRLILSDKAVVVAPKTKMYALSTADGTVLWSADHPRSGYVSPKDLFVIDGLVWYGDTAGAKNTGRFFGRDVMTGEIKKSFAPDIDIVWLSHHRCHFSKATRNFILPARMGVEFVDIENEKWKQHHWVRGGCIYGIMPCNGLIYTPPHACACYFEAKQTGFSAYTSNTGPASSAGSGERLEKGPAYGSISRDASDPLASEWPVFRHDSARSGHTASTVPTDLTQEWSADIGGTLTQPVMADGTIYVASVDRHVLHAIDARNGKPVWRRTVGGRIDSPPTIYRGLAIFGSRDGWVYCLRCSDGELVWRFRAVPEELLIMAYGQLESAWPVHGSVLIEDGEVHCVAGRNMFLDGGLRYLRLDPATGRLISETVMDEKDPLRGGSIQKYDSWLDMTTTMPDVLSSDGENIYMRSLPFDKTGKRRRITHLADKTETPHLFSPTGFLDNAWFHRSYWTFARSFPGGWIGHLNAGRYNPSGRLLVLDGSTIYGFGRKPAYYKWTTSLEYRLFAVDKTANKPRDIYAYDAFKVAQVKNFPGMKIDKQLGLPHGPRAVLKKSYDCTWENTDPPVLVRAMVSTKDCLFVAGPKDIMDEQSFTSRNATTAYGKMKNALKKQADIWQGKDGGLLHAVSKKDGTRIAEHRLDAMPVFDGMIAVEGKLLISLTNGRLICLGDKRTKEE